MSFISYAQNFEDIMLWRALKHIKRGFYIDIGAAWSSEHSVTKAFYEYGWHGINIEPNPQFYEQLQQQRIRDINLPFAIGNEPGMRQMHIINNTGLSTLDNEIAQKHIKSGWETKSHQVEMKTLSTICNTHIPANQEIHFLKVDVEGLELSVLESADWVKYRPWIVLVEATLPLSQEESHTEWEGILLSANYQFVYFDGLNRFYVAIEQTKLASAFVSPPNEFDDFIVASDMDAKRLLNVLSDIYASRSWRITAPLRKIHSKYLNIRRNLYRLIKNIAFTQK